MKSVIPAPAWCQDNRCSFRLSSPVTPNSICRPMNQPNFQLKKEVSGIMLDDM